MTCASTLSAQSSNQVQATGASAIWILANFCYAGMRAQDSSSAGWRMVAFLFGLPGTIITWLAVAEGDERVYGVEMPKRRR